MGFLRDDYIALGLLLLGVIISLILFLRNK